MSSQIRIVKEKLHLAITQLCETLWMFVKKPIDREISPQQKMRHRSNLCRIKQSLFRAFLHLCITNWPYCESIAK